MKTRVVFLVALVPFTAAAFSVPAHAQNHAQHYVLDAFGGVHAGGGAPLINPLTPYFGFDVAADIEFVPVGTGVAAGDGILVLDKFGGVHKGGALAAHPPSGGTPYFGFDAARAIVYRDISPRTVGNVGAAATEFTTLDFTFQSVVSASIVAPDDGYLLVTGSVGVNCLQQTALTTAVFSMNVDSTASDPDIAGGNGHFLDLDCPRVNFFSTYNSFQKLYPVSGGSHTAHVLYRHFGTSGMPSFRITSPVITVTFIDG